MAKKKTIPKSWQDFIKEVRHAIETEEDLGDFVERMQDGGFDVIYNAPNATKEKDVFLDVIRFFNKTCGTSYKENYPSAISNLIISRYKDGETADTMKRVIYMVALRFKGGFMEVNLRPDIIFQTLKFQAYAGQLPAIRKPQPALSSEAVNSKANPSNILLQSPATKPLTKEEKVNRDTEGMRECMEDVFMLDQKATNILLHILTINIVWDFLARIKIPIDHSIIARASDFAKLKVEEYKIKISELDEESSKETCRRYYILKSLFKGHTLGEVKALAQAKHFLIYHQ